MIEEIIDALEIDLLNIKVANGYQNDIFYVNKYFQNISEINNFVTANLIATTDVASDGENIESELNNIQIIILLHMNDVDLRYKIIKDVIKLIFKTESEISKLEGIVQIKLKETNYQVMFDEESKQFTVGLLLEVTYINDYDE